METERLKGKKFKKINGYYLSVWDKKEEKRVLIEEEWIITIKEVDLIKEKIFINLMDNNGQEIEGNFTFLLENINRLTEII